MNDTHAQKLRNILASHIYESVLRHNPKWDYIQHGIAIFGNSVLDAMEHIGLNRREELETALSLAQKRIEYDNHKAQLERAQAEHEATMERLRSLARRAG